MSSEECESCGASDTRLVVDHDHSHDEFHAQRKDSMCGECIRGRLCNGCNSALGMVGEDVARLEGLISYIKKHSPHI